MESRSRLFSIPEFTSVAIDSVSGEVAAMAAGRSEGGEAEEGGGSVIGIALTTTGYPARSPTARQQLDAGGVSILHKCDDSIKGGQYVIKGVLGRGRGGILYQAETQGGGERVAIRALSMRTISGLKKLLLFAKEAGVLRSLSHPGIPQYVDYFEEDSNGDRSFYLVQGLACGESLEDLVSQKGVRFSEAEVSELAVELLEILSYLESRLPPVVHGSINPGNIIVDVKSARAEGRWAGHVKIVNFGVIDEHMAMATTSAASTFFGTYVAPEQLQNHAAPQSDLYALGGTLLFLLSGQAPSAFPQKRLKVQFRDQVHMNGRLADMLDRLLEPAVEDRCASAEDALRVLRGLQPRGLQPRGLPLNTVPVSQEARTSHARTEFLCALDGSHVSLSVTGQEFAIDIPSKGLTTETCACGCNGVLLSFLASLVALSLIMNGVSPILAGLFLPLFVIGIAMIRFSLMRTLTTTSLKMVSNDRFTIRWSTCMGWSTTVHGMTSDIIAAREEVKYTWKGVRKLRACVLVEEPGFKRHRIGVGLKEEENRWLLEQINRFLRCSRAA